jgi:hypothetical protein
MRALLLLHPDHLLDRARRGSLSPEERRRLAAHQAICAACAWEQAALDDFAREADAFALDASHLATLAERTLVASGLVAGSPLGRSRPRPPRFWLAATAVAAAAVLALFFLPAREASREAPFSAGASLAATEASLDAGALGAPSGGDS